MTNQIKDGNLLRNKVNLYSQNVYFRKMVDHIAHSRNATNRSTIHRNENSNDKPQHAIAFPMRLSLDHQLIGDRQHTRVHRVYYGMEDNTINLVLLGHSHLVGF